MKRPLVILLSILIVGLISGCCFTVGHQKLIVKLGTEVPARTSENGDGEIIVYDGIDPKGEALFVFIGGRL